MFRWSYHQPHKSTCLTFTDKKVGNYLISNFRKLSLLHNFVVDKLGLISELNPAGASGICMAQLQYPTHTPGFKMWNSLDTTRTAHHYVMLPNCHMRDAEAGGNSASTNTWNSLCHFGNVVFFFFPSLIPPDVQETTAQPEMSHFLRTLNWKLRSASRFLKLFNCSIRLAVVRTTRKIQIRVFFSLQNANRIFT
jgi:hypothetical protein